MTISINTPHAEPTAVKEVIDWIEIQSKNLRIVLGRMKMLSKIDTSQTSLSRKKGVGSNISRSAMSPSAHALFCYKINSSAKE
jgi:hypothetical protein